MAKLQVKSYEAIIKEATLGPDDKKVETISKSKKIRAKSELEGKISKANLDLLDAEEAFENAVVSGTDIAAKALLLKGAQETHNFLVELNDGLFPSFNSAANS